MKNRILITGGAGFIGINSARHFLNKGWEVDILDNFSRKGADLNVKWLLDEYPSGNIKIIKAATPPSRYHCCVIMLIVYFETVARCL